jgi:predicted DCC family thiol-disulfide oxidoreductase YuxK
MNAHAVLYDGGCSFCTFQMKMLRWLDWRDRFAPIPSNDSRVAALAPSLTEDQMSEAIHCVTPGGHIHRGARAIRFIAMRLPVAVPLALILWLPGVILVAERVYALISRNRQWISRVFGCAGACSIVPSRRPNAAASSDLQ